MESFYLYLYSIYRHKHQDFVRTMREAEGADYVQCDCCGRQFNKTAAQRHIPFCKEQHERLPKKTQAQITAAHKLAVRTQYQPPKIRRGPAGIPCSHNDHSRHSYGVSYGYGSPGTVPVPRGLGSSVGGAGGISSGGRFCYDCGAKYPTPSAKFCCECGLARRA